MQFINNMRGIAILLIVFTHAIWVMPQPGDAGAFLDYFIGNGTIIFMFISGYLFSSTADSFKYTDYLKNKFMTVILPYIIVSFPATMLYVLHIKTNHLWLDMDWYFQLNMVERYLYMMVNGSQLGPLWFIPMVILFFITAPVFHFLSRTVLILPVFALSLVAAFLVDRPFGNSNVFQSFVFFIPIYLLGIMANRYGETILKMRPHILIAFLVYTAFFTAIYFIVFSEENPPTSSETMVLYLPLLLLSFVFCAKYLDYKIIWLDMFARLSFFIFFIHGYFPGALRVMLRLSDVTAKIENPFIEVPIITVVFFIILFLSLASYVVLKFMLGKRSRYMIGG